MGGVAASASQVPHHGGPPWATAVASQPEADVPQVRRLQEAGDPRTRGGGVVDDVATQV